MGFALCALRSFPWEPAISNHKISFALMGVNRQTNTLPPRQNSKKASLTPVTSDTRSWHPKSGKKGIGIESKKASFKRWYEKTMDGSNSVYVFWSKKRCEYIGRTLRGKRRPTSHFEKYWFRSVTRVTIYTVRNPSEVPKTECLAIHLFKPRRNKVKSAKVKYTKKCPVCIGVKGIRQELRDLFRLR